MLNRTPSRTVYLNAMSKRMLMSPFGLAAALASLLSLFPLLPLAADPAADAYRQGHARLNEKRYAEAAVLFAAAAASSNATSAAAAWLGRGEAFYGAKQWDAAIAAYHTLLQTYPDSPHAARALCGRGFAEYQAGQLCRAQASFADFTARYPHHALAATVTAAAETVSRTLASQAKQRESETLARELAAIQAQVSSGMFGEASRAAARFLSEHPGHSQSAALCFLAANCAWRAKDYPFAADRYRAYLAQHPQHAQVNRAWFELGATLEALSRYEEAAEAFAKAAGSEQASALRAECLLKAGRFEEALHLFEPLARDTADAHEKARATLAAGDCYAALKKWPEAERAFLSVEVLDADDALRPAALGRLADLYGNMGQSDKALRTREELKRRFPGWK